MSNIIGHGLKLSKTGKSFTATPLFELYNSMGGFMFVIQAMANKYFGIQSVITGLPPDFWKLRLRDDLLECERAVFILCLDYGILSARSYSRMADCLREFERIYSSPDRICHLSKIADFIEKCSQPHLGITWHDGGDDYFSPLNKSRVFITEYPFFSVEAEINNSGLIW